MNVQLIENFVDLDLETVRKAIDFVQRSVTVYGKVYPQPRLTRWYGSVPYAYSGLVWEPEPLTGLLEALRAQVSAHIGTPLNSVLCNLYRDGQDCVGWHADDEPIFGRDPVVASLSFGATRAFKVRSKADTSSQESFELTHGSLLVMGTGIQPGYQHCVPKTKKVLTPRVNLTFRQTVG